jgi:hypothetical protein
MQKLNEKIPDREHLPRKLTVVIQIFLIGNICLYLTEITHNITVREYYDAFNSTVNRRFCKENTEKSQHHPERPGAHFGHGTPLYHRVGTRQTYVPVGEGAYGLANTRHCRAANRPSIKIIDHDDSNIGCLPAC